MSKVIRLNQNTEEWLSWRNGGIGASDAPVILGQSPWKTPYQLYIEKTTGETSFQGNQATNKGHRLESFARKAAEEELNMIFHPKCYQHVEYSWMRASLDGISMDGEILEIKCPYNPNDPKSDHQLALNGEIPEKYYAQLQHQLAVAQASKGYYYSFDGEKGVVIPFERDEDFILKLIDKEKAFCECLQKLKPPKLTVRDYQVFEGEELCKKADRVLTLRKEAEAVKEELDALESELKTEYAQETGAILGNLRITRFLKKGSIDYTAIPEIKEVDLERYRRPMSIGYRLSEVHENRIHQVLS